MSHHRPQSLPSDAASQVRRWALKADAQDVLLALFGALASPGDGGDLHLEPGGRQRERRRQLVVRQHARAHGYSRQRWLAVLKRYRWTRE